MVTTLFILAFIFALLLPTLLVVMLAQWTLNRRPLQAHHHALVRYSLLAYLIIAIPYATLSLLQEEETIGPVFLLVLPALDGLLALLLVNWRIVLEYWQVEKRLASLLLVALLAVLLVSAISRPELALILLLPPLLAALVWSAGSRLGSGWLAALAVILVSVLILDATGAASSHAVYSSDRLRTLYQVSTRITVLLALALAAVFVYRVYRSLPAGAGDSLSPGQAVTGSRKKTVLLFAALLLLGVAAVTFRDGMIASATGRAFEDHLPFVSIAAGLIAGLVLALSLPVQSRRIGVGFLLAVTIILPAAFSLGWRVDYEAVTAGRAASLSQAISRYREATGEYPAGLGELSPRYLPVVLGPLTGSGQVWCYQSGPGYYRLGYVYFQRYHQYPDNTPFWEPFYEIRQPYSAGQPPAGGWICDQELLLYKKHGGL